MHGQTTNELFMSSLVQVVFLQFCSWGLVFSANRDWKRSKTVVVEDGTYDRYSGNYNACD